MISKLKHLLKLHGQQHGTGDANRSLSVNCSGCCRTQGATSMCIYLDMSASFSFSLSLLSLSSLPPHFFPSLFLLSFLLPFSLPFSFPPFSRFLHFFLSPPHFQRFFPQLMIISLSPLSFSFFFFSSPWINLQNAAFLYSLPFCSKPPSRKPDPSDTSPFSQGPCLLSFLKTLIIHFLC